MQTIRLSIFLPHDVGDWATNLTKTPYLVLFVILISIGVGTASALITITLAGDVVITDDLTVDTSTLFVDSTNDKVGIGTTIPQQKLDVNGNARVQGDLFLDTLDISDDDIIFFDDTFEKLFWDESDSQFEFTNAVVTTGVIQTGNVGADVGYNRLGTGAADSGHVISNNDLFVTGNIETDLDFFSDGNIFLGTDDDSDDDAIFFDSGSEFLFWDESESQFQFSNAVVTTGVIQAGNLGADVAYNRLGMGTADSGSVTTSSDLFVSGGMEADGFLFADSLLLVGTDDGSDDDFICMDGPGCSAFLAWDESASQFEFNNTVVIKGVIQAGNDGPDVGYNRLGTSTANSGNVTASDDLFVSGNIETDLDLFADDDIFVGTDNGGDDDAIFFDSGSEFLFWDESEIQFQISDDLGVFGKLTATSIDPAYVSYSGETHDSIKFLAQDVSDHEEVMHFWNKDNNRFEVYVISQDAFYTLVGKEVKYESTGIPAKSAVNRIAEFEEQEKASKANPAPDD